MQNVSTGLFSQTSPTHLRQQMKDFHQDIAGNAELINDAIVEIDQRARKGGCISIVGPNPALAHRYELEKEVLKNMLAEAEALTATKKPGA